MNLGRIDAWLDGQLESLRDIRAGLAWLGYGARVVVVAFGLGCSGLAYYVDLAGLAVGALLVTVMADLATDRLREHLDDGLAAGERLLAPLAGDDLASYERRAAGSMLRRKPRGADLDLLD